MPTEEVESSHKISVQIDDPNQWQKDLLSISAFIISLCALGASILFGLLTYENNKLSVTPRLNFGFLLSGNEKDVGVYLENNGVGPAIISSFSIFYKNKKINNWNEVKKYLDQRFFTEYESKTKKIDPIWWAPILGSYFRSSLRVKIYHTPISNVYAPYFENFLKRHLEIEVEYCSVYGECWLTCLNRTECRNQALPVSIDF